MVADGVDDFAVFEGELHAVAFAAVMHGGEAEVDLAIDAVDDRAGEDFAIGEILVAVAIDPGHAGDAHADIGSVGSDDVIVALAVQEIGELLLALADLFPGCDGVGMIEQAGAEDEILIFGQTHLGILRRGLCGELRAAPAQCAAGGTFHEGVEQRLSRCGLNSHALRIDIRHRAGVFFRPDGDRAVDRFAFEFGDGGDVLQLLIAGLFQENLVGLFDGDAQERMTAGLDHVAKKLGHQWLGGDWASNTNQLVFLHADTVIHQHFRKFL